MKIRIKTVVYQEWRTLLGITSYVVYGGLVNGQPPYHRRYRTNGLSLYEAKGGSVRNRRGYAANGFIGLCLLDKLVSVAVFYARMTRSLRLRIAIYVNGRVFPLPLRRRTYQSGTEAVFDDWAVSAGHRDIGRFGMH